MAQYRYYFGSLRTEEVIAEIDLFGTFLDLELNIGGQFNGSYKLDQTGKRNRDLLEATIPGRSFVICERNGVAIWGGFIWSRTYQSQAKNIQMFGLSFEHYPYYRVLENDFALFGDQIDVFRQLWLDMQDDSLYPGGNLNIIVPSNTFTSTDKFINALGTDKRIFGELMSELADAVDGFDWYISCSRSGSTYRKDLVIGYPTIGSPLGPNSLIYQYPGSVLNYYQVESMSEAGTHVQVVGSGEGNTMVVGYSRNEEMIAQGWPRWDKVVSRKDITSFSTIDKIATQEGITRRPPMTMLKISMKADETPEFGDFGIGDTVRVVIQDARNEDELDFPGRIVKWELNPPTTENSEEYNLIFQGDNETE